jgi:uncharacterized membrane protein YccC
VDRSQFEGVAALRCTVGVAVPLIVGLVMHQPSVGVFGAVGALSVGFGSFRGVYRSRATLMLTAAVGMAVSVFIGSLAGGSIIATILVGAAWAFGIGLLVAVGPGASFVGLQSTVAALVASGFPTGLNLAAVRLLAVLAGGAIQTVLVVVLWPLRGFPAERRVLATVYRSLAAYADGMPQPTPKLPEPYTLAEARPTLADPQPFASVSEVLVFRALLDEAERIRAFLGALALHHGRRGEGGSETAPHILRRFTDEVAQLLREIGSALEDAREPLATAGFWDALEASAAALRDDRFLVDGLLGQLRSAWRIAGTLRDGGERDVRVDGRVRPLPRLPPIRDALEIFRVNLTLQSTAFRHAVRLTVAVALATAIYRVATLPRGYWLPMTALLVLRPAFGETFAAAVARVAGTLLGAVGATLITVALAPGPVTLLLLVLLFVWSGYASFRTNYAIFTICLTGYVVFLLALAGVPETASAIYRSEDTALGGVLALLVFAVWPTWEGSHVRDRLAALLDAHGRYVARLLASFVDPARRDRGGLESARARARLARSNADASVERMLTEPVSRRSIDPRVAVGVLAASRRHALAALALHARLEREPRVAFTELDPLANQITTTLGTLAEALRSQSSPRALPPLRETQDALRATTRSPLTDDTDVMVDSLNTMAELLGGRRERLE